MKEPARKTLDKEKAATPSTTVQVVEHENKLMTMVQSRRFWVALAGLAVIVLGDGFGVYISMEEVVGIVGIVGTWIMGDSFRRTE